MKILLASVHHTGTNTVQEMLESCYGEQLNFVKPERANGWMRIHIDRKFLKDLLRWATTPIIVPMRHPRDVAISWKTRDWQDIWELGSQWSLLKKVIAPLNPLYLPVDTPDRDEYLAKINEKWGLELTTDWPKVNATKLQKVPLDDEENKIVDLWMEDGFFERFGYK